MRWFAGRPGSAGLIAGLIAGGMLGACEAGPAVRAGARDATGTGDGATAGDGSPGDAGLGTGGAGGTDGRGGADAAGAPDAGPGVQGRLALNEAMPTPPDGEADWFELVALGDGPVSLSDYAVVDADPDHRPIPLPERTLQPGDFVRFHAGDDAPAGAFALPFGLGRDDGLRLLRDGETIDGLHWSEVDVGPVRSWGRLPDGTGEPQSLSPTPGAPNLAAVPESSLFDPTRLVDFALRFSPADWAAWSGVAAPTTPLPAQLALRDAPPRAVAVRRDSAAETLIVDLDPARRGEGVEGRRQLVLHCNTADPTRLRDVVALQIAGEFGVQAPAAVLARARLQDEDAALCTLREAVDADFAAARFGAGAGTLFRVAPPAADLVYRGRSAEDYVGLAPLAPADADPTDVLVLAAALNMGDPAAYPSVLVLEETLRVLVLQGALVDFSGYGGEGAQLALFDAAGHILPVPLGMPGAFAGAGCACEPAAAEAWPVLSAACGALEGRPLIRRLQEPTMVRERALGALRELLDGPLATEAFAARVEGWAAVARTGPVPPDFERALVEGSPGGPPGLLDFARRRTAALRAQLTGESPATAPVRVGCRP